MALNNSVIVLCATVVAIDRLGLIDLYFPDVSNKIEEIEADMRWNRFIDFCNTPCWRYKC